MKHNCDTRHHFLYSGTIHVERHPAVIETVLGSCVSVCLYDKLLRFGGMNHFMLPLWNGEGLATPKYGNVAIERLLEKMMALGSTKGSIVAKIFGGADVNEGVSAYQIGQRNISMAIETLSALAIPILANNTGGRTGRKVVFQSDTGIVFLKMIANTNLPEIISQHN